VRDIDGVLAAFYRQYNLFRSKLGHIPSVIQFRLFKTYCSSFYGVTLLPFKLLPRLHVAWRKASRQIWRLPYRAHNMTLRCLNHGLCEVHSLILRHLKFAWSTLNCRNMLVSYVMQCTLDNKKSLATDNIISCCSSVNIDINNLKTMTLGALEKVSQSACLQCRTESAKLDAMTINELSQIRDGLLTSPLNNEEAETIISFLSIN